MMNKIKNNILTASILWGFFVFNVNAQSLFQNNIEGESGYLSKKVSRRFRKYNFEKLKEPMVTAFESAKRKSKLCTYDLYQSYLTQTKFDQKKTYYSFHYLRSINIFDDIILKRLLRQIPLHQKDISFHTSYRLDLEELEILDKVILPQANKVRCITEDIPRVYKALVSEFSQKKTRRMVALLKAYASYRPQLADIMRPMILLVQQEGENWKLNLKDYLSKKSELRAQRENIDSPIKFSEFASEYIKKEERTRRERLYEDYSLIQIILLKGIIEELIRDLEATRLEYVLYNAEDEIISSYIADPMEQFCLTINLMRKKIATLKENFFFKNKTSHFEDVLMASLELGVIQSYEFDSILAFKEIWDPNLSFWEKNRTWIQTFGSLGAVILPPPWGVIPMLAITTIEAVRLSKEGNTNSLHNVCRMTN
jgi:hypothetical protein